MDHAVFCRIAWAGDASAEGFWGRLTFVEVAAPLVTFNSFGPVGRVIKSNGRDGDVWATSVSGQQRSIAFAVCRDTGRWAIQSDTSSADVTSTAPSVVNLLLSRQVERLDAGEVIPARAVAPEVGLAPPTETSAPKVKRTDSPQSPAAGGEEQLATSTRTRSQGSVPRSSRRRNPSSLTRVPAVGAPPRPPEEIFAVQLEQKAQQQTTLDVPRKLDPYALVVAAIAPYDPIDSSTSCCAAYVFRADGVGSNPRDFGDWLHQQVAQPVPDLLVASSHDAALGASHSPGSRGVGAHSSLSATTGASHRTTTKGLAHTSVARSLAAAAATTQFTASAVRASCVHIPRVIAFGQGTELFFFAAEPWSVPPSCAGLIVPVTSQLFAVRGPVEIILYPTGITVTPLWKHSLAEDLQTGTLDTIRAAQRCCSAVPRPWQGFEPSATKNIFDLTYAAVADPHHRGIYASAAEYYTVEGDLQSAGFFRWSVSDLA